MKKGPHKLGGLRVPLLALGLAIALPLSFPAAQASAASSKQMAKQIKALKRQATALTAKLEGLQAKASALEAEGAGTPSLSGPAGGDLTGGYPNPQIRTGAIGTSQLSNGAILGRHLTPNTLSGAHLADSSIGPAQLATGLSIGQSDLVPGSVGAPHLLGAFVVRKEESFFLDAFEEASEPVSPNPLKCPGDSRLLAAGLEQDLTKPPREWDDVVATKSVPDADNPDHEWEMRVWLNKSEAKDPIFQTPLPETRGVFTNLLCLPA